MTPETSISMQSQMYDAFSLAMRDGAEAIRASADRVSSESVMRAVGLISDCDGKRVFFGVGKSGHVARKIAATFSSLNLPSIFVHASEAVHGDLGVLTSGDIAVMISNSGDTDELVALLPHLRRRRIPLIAIVGNCSSTLARDATVVLDATVSREICPLNLAPTASTLVALAIGDALAATLTRLRNLGRDDFALNHPSGRLGKRLTLRARNFLRDSERLPNVSPDASWREVILALSEFRYGAVNVTDETGKLLGLITDGDLRRALSRDEAIRIETLSAEALMTRSPLTIKPDTLVYEAMQLMSRHGDRGVSVLPVVDDHGIALGILRLQDLAKAGI